MTSMKITNWLVQECKIASPSFDDIFSFQQKPTQKSKYQKPFLAILINEVAEIIIDRTRFLHLAESLEEIPVYFISEETPAIQIMQIVVDYFLADNELNPLIISKILHYIEAKDVDELEQKKLISQKLKISPKLKVVEKYKKYVRIEGSICDFLISKKSPLKVWDYLTEFSEQEQEFLCQLIDDTKPSLGNFLEIIENLSEVQKISAKSYLEIYKQLDLIQILKNESKTKLQEIKDKIIQSRYPSLIGHRDEINSLFIAIAKPNNLNLQHDQTYEKKEVRGFFSINNEADFDALQKFFSSDNKEKFLDILKKI